MGGGGREGSLDGYFLEPHIQASHENARPDLDILTVLGITPAGSKEISRREVTCNRAHDFELQ